MAAMVFGQAQERSLRRRIVWAEAVKRFFPQVEIRQAWGHYVVVFDNVAYDSDAWRDGGLDPKESSPH